MQYRPHSFDSQGFLFGMKCLFVLVVVLVGVRYGTAFASDVVRGNAEAQVAGAAAAVTSESSSSIAALPDNAPKGPSIHVTTPAPKTGATAYIVANLSGGEVYASKDADTPYPIASISKLLVALASREALSPEADVTITRADRAQTEGTPGSIQRDETFTASDLLYPLLMESNNSVAYALERTGGGDEFVRIMLRIAHKAGMDETLLNDSSGLSARNEASAHDLAELARYIMTNDADLFAITRTKTKAVTAKSGRTYPTANLNIYASDETFIGGKTGYTDEARQTMLALFEAPVDGMESPAQIVIIVLGSSDRKRDVNALREWFGRSAVFE